MASKARRRDHDDGPAPSARVAALYRRILDVARRVPRGRVVTYGQLAELAGIPGGARVAAAAMKVSGGAVPWQRVVGKRGGLGRIAILDPVGAATQRALLEREGVAVDERGMMKLADFGWVPLDGAPGRRRR
jgi:methylated-DNA-protein-cysteine methyltransferase-like protein